MIQTRNNIFETNSSSTHCLTVMNRNMYDDWHSHKIVLSINYVWSSEDFDERLGTLIEPSINLPENFIDKNKAESLARKKYGDSYKYYYFTNLTNGDNGFMGTNGNFDTYGSIVREIPIESQKEENIKILEQYIYGDQSFINWLKENNKYEHILNLISQYKETGEFTEDMYKRFPTYLFYTPEQYADALKFDDCDSPFIHMFADVVAFGYYFHS